MEGPVMRAVAKCLVCLLVVGTLLYVTAGPVGDQPGEVSARSIPEVNDTLVEADKDDSYDDYTSNEYSDLNTNDVEGEKDVSSKEEKEIISEETILPQPDEKETAVVEETDEDIPESEEIWDMLENGDENAANEDETTAKLKKKKSRKNKKGKKRNKKVKATALKTNSTDVDLSNSTDIMLADDWRVASPYDIRTLDTYLGSCPTCWAKLGNYPDMVCPLHDEALGMLQWAKELEDVLSHGCCCKNKDTKTGRCTDSCCLTSDPVFVKELIKVSQLLNNLFKSVQSNCECDKPVPVRECVPAEWSSWGLWSVCTQPCGLERVTRSRVCEPSPFSDILNCPTTCFGDEVESKMIDCGPTVEGVWLSWGNWGACSSGLQERSRRCTQLFPSLCSQECVGEETQTKWCCEAVDAEWGQWAPWTACHKTCGEAIVRRKRRCIKSSANACGKRQCFGDNAETKLIRCGPDSAIGSWEPWGNWGRCSASCGMGVQERSRRCDNLYLNSCDTDCLGPEIQTKECGTPGVIGTWESWGNWGRCSASCGMGVQERSRRCDNLYLSSCDTDCLGPEIQTKECGTPEVLSVWEPWGQWSDCLDDCGMQEVRRTRYCTRSPCGGSRCFGDEVERKEIWCGPEREIGYWEPWGNWGRCSSTCGLGVQERSRRCSIPFPNRCSEGCEGPETSTKECGMEVEPSFWGQWQPWSQCVADCGTETVTRERFCTRSPCDNNRCFGDEIERKEIQCGPERVISNWEPWGNWGRCSSSCGLGVRERSRRCDNPYPNRCSEGCFGPEVENQPCGVDVLPSVWQMWTAWSDCLDMCGEEMVRRTRYCSRSPCGGEECFGDQLEEKTIRCGPPKRVGRWEMWGSWGRCSATCGQGVQERSRRCDVVFPDRCSEGCVGPETEDRTCDNPADWSQWEPWSRCLRMCGTETVTRRRRCTCGDCGGGDFEETKLEICGPERVDGRWETWMPWSRCSASCGLGMQERRRRCSVTYPNECSRGCVGGELEQQPCGQPVRDSQWNSWSSWSACSATCGDGYRTRSRSCQRDFCSRPCPGPAVERDDITCGAILSSCHNFQFSEWAKWCPCDCVTGNTTRQRFCEQVHSDGRRTRVNLARCMTEGQLGGRQEEFCVNVPSVDECELCITSCSDKFDGHYQSCRDCREYVVCENRAIKDVMVCNEGSFSAFDGQCSLKSKSCAVKKPITNCRGKPDGKYPADDPSSYILCKNERKSTRDCTWADMFKYKHRNHLIKRPPISGFEYNHQLRACESFRSPTSKRELETPLIPVVDTILLSDDPNSFAESNEINETTNKEEKEKKDVRRMNRKCITSCEGVDDGFYGSCRGCDIQAECKDGNLRETRCPDKKEFNVKKHKCVNKSATCELRGMDGWLADKDDL